MTSKNLTTSQQYTIELDCAPFTPRPDAYLPGVLEGTGLALGEPVAKLFGNWTWLVPVDQTALYEQHRELIKERITKLYHEGAIRYGSW